MARDDAAGARPRRHSSAVVVRSTAPSHPRRVQDESMKTLIAAACSIALLTAAPRAQDLVQRIDRGLQQYVDDARVAGVVALVLQDGKPVYECFHGFILYASRVGRSGRSNHHGRR